MSKEDTIALFQRHFKDRGLFQSLDAYLEKKEIYLKDRTRANFIELKLAYEYIYCDMKYWLSAGTISSNTFWELVDILQEEL